MADDDDDDDDNDDYDDGRESFIKFNKSAGYTM